MEADRREILRQMSLLLAGMSGASLLASCKRGTGSAADAGRSKKGDRRKSKKKPADARAFLPFQRKTLEPALARILPTDAGPGAREAGIIDYIDRELARPEWVELKKHVVAGIVAMNRKAQREYQKPFAKLAEAEQDAVLKKIQEGSDRGADFIRFLVILTMEGFFGDPKWGGNKGEVGWDLSGYGPAQCPSGAVGHAHKR